MKRKQAQEHPSWKGSPKPTPCPPAKEGKPERVRGGHTSKATAGRMTPKQAMDWAGATLLYTYGPDHVRDLVDNGTNHGARKWYRLQEAVLQVMGRTLEEWRRDALAGQVRTVEMERARRRKMAELRDTLPSGTAGQAIREDGEAWADRYGRQV